MTVWLNLLLGSHLILKQVHARSHGAERGGDLLGVCGQVTPAWLEDFCELVTSAGTIVLAMLIIFFAAFSLAKCLLNKVEHQNLYILWSPTRFGRLFGKRCRLKLPGGDCNEGEPVAVLVAGRYEAAEFAGAVAHNLTYQAQFQVRDGTLLLMVDEMLRGDVCLVTPPYYVGFAAASLDDVRRGLRRPADSKPEEQAMGQSNIGSCAIPGCVTA